MEVDSQKSQQQSRPRALPQLPKPPTSPKPPKPLSSADAQQWARRLRLSKEMFDRTQHRVEMQVKVATGITTVPMEFPNAVADFNGAYARQFGEQQSPQWFCENAHRLILRSDQLPDYATVRRVGAQYISSLGDTMVNDAPKGACRAFARPIIMNLPDEGSAVRDLQLEAELKFPFAIQPDTILRFTVQGTYGWLEPSKTQHASRSRFDAIWLELPTMSSGWNGYGQDAEDHVVDSRRRALRMRGGQL